MQFSTRTKIIIVIILLFGSSVLLSMIELSPAPETSTPEVSVFYVKATGANVRECPSTNCKVFSTLSQGTNLSFPGDLYDKYPDWAEITFSDGQVGYVSKSTLSSETPVAVQPFQPQRDEIAVVEEPGTASIPSSSVETVPPLPVEKAAPLDQETLDYLLEVAMKNEFDDTRSTLVKWTKPKVAIKIFGTADTKAAECLDRVIEDFNSLSTTTKFTLTQGGADIDFYFAPENEFQSIVSNYIPVNLGFFSYYNDRNNVIYSSKVLIDNTSRINDQERCHLIREELTQTMGLTNDSNKYPDSMFYAPWTTTNRYSPMDERLIKALYATNIKPGLNIEEVISYFSP